METRQSRTELLIKGLTLRHKRVTLFDKNPQSTRNNDPDTKVEKIIIKDLPIKDLPFHLTNETSCFDVTNKRCS